MPHREANAVIGGFACPTTGVPRPRPRTGQITVTRGATSGDLPGVAAVQQRRDVGRAGGVARGQWPRPAAPSFAASELGA